MSGFGARNIQMDRRGERVFEAIVESGSLVVRQFGGDRAGEVGAHRFFEAPDVSFKTIGDRFAARTRHAGQGRRIVVAQDTTEINFSGRDRGRKGLGPAGNGKALGFFVHPLIAVDIDTEALLGLCWSKIWTRSDTGLRHRRARDFADKVLLPLAASDQRRRRAFGRGGGGGGDGGRPGRRYLPSFCAPA